MSLNIAIVGAGQAALLVLNHFTTYRSHNVIGVSDLKEDAPAMLRAKELKLITTTNMGELIKRRDVDMVIELTGSEKVEAMIREQLRPNQSVLSASGAKLMCEVIEAQGAHTQQLVSSICEQFNETISDLETALLTLSKSSKLLEQLLKKGDLISVNANVEAARAGESGRAFATVVNEIHNLVQQMQQSLTSINGTSDNMQTTVGKLHTAESSLRNTFI
jgi:methyl-accepting chemotaxis protein